MKNTIIKRAVSLLLALVCVMGVLPLSAFAAGLSSAPGSITQRSSDYMKIGGNRDCNGKHEDNASHNNHFSFACLHQVPNRAKNTVDSRTTATWPQQ